MSHSQFTVLEFSFWCASGGLQGVGEPQRVEEEKDGLSPPMKHGLMEKYF